MILVPEQFNVSDSEMRRYITEARAQFVIGMKVFIVVSNKYHTANIHWRSTKPTLHHISVCEELENDDEVLG